MLSKVSACPNRHPKLPYTLNVFVPHKPLTTTNETNHPEHIRFPACVCISRVLLSTAVDISFRTIREFWPIELNSDALTLKMPLTTTREPEYEQFFVSKTDLHFQVQ